MRLPVQFRSLCAQFPILPVLRSILLVQRFVPPSSQLCNRGADPVPTIWSQSRGWRGLQDLGVPVEDDADAALRLGRRLGYDGDGSVARQVVFVSDDCSFTGGAVEA